MAAEFDCVTQVARASHERQLVLLESLALGLLVLRKWDRASLSLGKPAPTAAEAVAFDHFTNAELSEFRGKAKALLDEYAILRRSPVGWWSGFWQGYTSSIAYALTLALAAILIKLNGSDAWTLLQTLFGGSR